MSASCAAAGARSTVASLDRSHGKRHVHVEVEGIGTEPMTCRQREQAVAALAALIQGWSRSEAACRGAAGHAGCQSPLPLVGTESDTDPAG